MPGFGCCIKRFSAFRKRSVGCGIRAGRRGVYAGMDLEKSEAAAGEGCLVVAVRIPVRIVMLVLLVPVRMVWDALVVVARFLNDTVFRPVGRVLLWLGRAVFVWPFVALWRYVVVPLGRALGWLGKVLLVRPAVWVYRHLLTPLGHGIMWLLAPVGRAIGWCLHWVARVLLVLPALVLWRWMLAPVGRFLAVVGREIADALGHAWRIAGRMSLAVARFLAAVFGTVLRWIVVEPVRWVHRTVLAPVGCAVRDAVLRPVAAAVRRVGQAARQVLAAARDSARQARADLRRALFGEPRQARTVDRREPYGPDTRTLGSSTTALTKD